MSSGQYLLLIAVIIALVTRQYMMVVAFNAPLLAAIPCSGRGREGESRYGAIAIYGV
nr:hypothetical protein [Ktedonobacteraceae bacterium]